MQGPEAMQVEKTGNGGSGSEVAAGLAFWGGVEAGAPGVEEAGVWP